MLDFNPAVESSFDKDAVCYHKSSPPLDIKGLLKILCSLNPAFDADVFAAGSSVVAK
jgi:hypothetical protein